MEGVPQPEEQTIVGNVTDDSADHITFELAQATKKKPLENNKNQCILNVHIALPFFY
jgi:hypothetical protein